MKRLLASLALSVSLAAVAAAPSTTLTWIPSTTKTDGTPVGSSTFTVYAGPSGAETLYRAGITGAPGVIVPGVSGTTMCFQVTQTEIASGLESEKSPEICKVFQAAPNAPTGVTAK